jgi:hypothetical protein
MAAAQSEALFSVFRALANSSQPAETARDVLNFASSKLNLAQRDDKDNSPAVGSATGNASQHHCSTGEKLLLDFFRLAFSDDMMEAKAQRPRNTAPVTAATFSNHFNGREEEVSPAGPNEATSRMVYQMRTGGSDQPSPRSANHSGNAYEVELKNHSQVNDTGDAMSNSNAGQSSNVSKSGNRTAGKSLEVRTAMARQYLGGKTMGAAGTADALDAIDELGKKEDEPEDDRMLFDGDLELIGEDRSSLKFFSGGSSETLPRIGSSLVPRSANRHIRDICKNLSRIYYPTELWLVFWNVSSLILLVVFAMMAPIELGFDVYLAEEYQGAYVFYEVLTVWFIVDMWLCFRTAYTSPKGQVVTDPHKVAIYYLRTWFIIDLIATFPFHWILPLFMPPQEDPAMNPGNLRFMRFTRFSRFLRTLKLLRMLRLSSVVSTYEDELSDEAEAAVHLTQRALFVFVVIGHWLACLWVMVARDTEDPESGNWMISISGDGGMDLDFRASPWRVYCFALKFSIGEITTLASYVSEHARTNEELLFNCVTNVHAFDCRDA